MTLSYEELLRAYIDLMLVGHICTMCVPGSVQQYNKLVSDMHDYISQNPRQTESERSINYAHNFPPDFDLRFGGEGPKSLLRHLTVCRSHMC